MTLYTCKNPDCPVKNSCEDIPPCHIGNTHEDCEDFYEVSNDENIEENEDSQSKDIDLKEILVCNTHINYDQIKFFSLEAEPSIATFIGLPNVGKTSLLTSIIYALRMGNDADLGFMGSSTLNAWNQLIDLTHYAHGETPQHPERTIDRPGTRYLHLLAKHNGKGSDLFLGDTAGEIFSSLIGNSDEQSQEYQRIVQWITEAKILLICLDSSEYYPDKLWLSKDNHTIFIDRVSEIIAKYNPNVDIIFIETKYDLVQNNKKVYQYHEQVNQYFFDRFKNILKHIKTISITAKQGEFPVGVGEIATTCFAAQTGKNTHEDLNFVKYNVQDVYSELKEWI